MPRASRPRGSWSCWASEPTDGKPRVLVRAPIDGKVLEVSVAPGEYRTDTAAPLMTVADLTTVWIASDVPESSVRLIHVGDPVSIGLLAYPGEIFTGRIARIADTLDPQTRTLKVYVELPNPRGRLRPEMFATVHHSGAPRMMPVLPPGAIVQEYGRSTVFLERAPGQYERREVTVGPPVGEPCAGARGGAVGRPRGRGRSDAPQGPVGESAAVVVSRLVQFALARRLVIVAAALVLAGAGVWAFRHLKIEAYPDLTDPTVVVITLYPGFAAEEVEQQVTVPIERALNNTPFVISRRSRTIFGLSVVELTFEDGIDNYLARQLVLERVQAASLPEGVTPTLGPLSGGVSEFYRYVVVGAGRDAMSLREIQDWVVGPRLLQVPGVADVATFGGLVRQYEIQVDPRALDQYRLGIRQVAEAVKNNNRNAGGALLRMGEQALPIRGSGLIGKGADIENIVLDAPKGAPIFVRDIGRVQVGTLPQTGIFAMDDQPLGAGGIEGIVLMRRGENPSEVLPRVRAAVEELNARLPQGVRLVAIHDRSDLVQSTLRTVSHVLVAGLCHRDHGAARVPAERARGAAHRAHHPPLPALRARVHVRERRVAEPPEHRRARLRDHRRRDDRHGGADHSRAVGARAERPGRRRARGRRHRRPGRLAADSLLLADHHRRLHSAPDARARGAPPVHPDGAHRLLRAAGLAAVQPDADSGARDVSVSRPGEGPPASSPRGHHGVVWTSPRPGR